MNKLIGSNAYNITSGKVPLYSNSGWLYCDLIKFRKRNIYIYIYFYLKPNQQSSNQILIIPNLGGSDRTLMFTSTHQTIRDNQTFEEPITCNKQPTQNSHLTRKDYVNNNFLKLDGTNNMLANLNIDDNQLTNVADLNSETDGANKRYVDNKTKGGPSHSLTNTFKYIMDDIDEISTEYGWISDKIDNLSWSFHSVVMLNTWDTD